MLPPLFPATCFLVLVLLFCLHTMQDFIHKFSRNDLVNNHTTNRIQAPKKAAFQFIRKEHATHFRSCNHSRHSFMSSFYMLQGGPDLVNHFSTLQYQAGSCKFRAKRTKSGPWVKTKSHPRKENQLGKDQTINVYAHHASDNSFCSTLPEKSPFRIKSLGHRRLE